jgi:uncharacterized membrane protein
MTEVSMEAYTLSIVGVLALCLLSVLLANLLYRIDRVHMNSVEALAPFVVLAMMVGVGPTTLAVLVWSMSRSA